MLNSDRLGTAILFIGLLIVAGCGDSPPAPGGDYGGGTGGYGYGQVPENIQFLDSVESNALSASGFDRLTFLNVEGEEVQLSDLLGKKNIVLVVTRGHTGPICPYCSTQTSRLISNYDQFTKRNADVVVVYPVETQADSTYLDGFLAATREKLTSPKSDIQFPILLDVELKSVSQLGIRQDLSKPATYILDTDGQVRFAYVGSTIADRPSIKALLAQLDVIVGSAADGEAADDEAGSAVDSEPETKE